MAIVAEGDRGRVYLSPTPNMEASCPSGASRRGSRGTQCRERRAGTRLPLYGLTHLRRPFYSSPARGADDSFRPSAGGTERVKCRLRWPQGFRRRQAALMAGRALAYAEAVGVYLALAVGQGSRLRLVARQLDEPRRTTPCDPAFQRQAMPMTWDFAEANPFAAPRARDSHECVNVVAKVLDALHVAQGKGRVTRFRLVRTSHVEWPGKVVSALIRPTTTTLAMRICRISFTSGCVGH